MPVIRHHHTENYTVIPNAIFNDARLNFSDIGLLCYMLHLPDNWVFSVRGLSTALHGGGKDKITASLKRKMTSSLRFRDMFDRVLKCPGV